MKFYPSLRKVIPVLILLVCSGWNKAEDKTKYNISDIPVILMIDADAVIRDYSIVFKVENEEKAVMYYTYAVTVLNKQGQHFGEFWKSYGKFNKIDDLEGIIYDTNGKKIRKLDGDEIRDNAIISWAQLYSDRRYKAADLYHNKFPYTVEFTYKEKYDGYLNWPNWIPEEESASVQHSSYEIVIPKELELRYKCYNWSVEPVITPYDGKNLSYKWEVDNLPPFEPEPIGPSSYDQKKIVITAPNKFKMDDYKGDLTTWENFGLWSKELWEGKQELLPSSAEEIRALLTPEMNRKEKICILYNYLQSKTRYVNINAGIGGWQPVEAQKVHECGYGDCKALSNYMMALLDSAGIKAYPVLIESGNKPSPLETSFSYNQFNHVIICVPENADTVWLECTSQSLPCGYLGSFTENRYGLLISEDGGKLVKTPSSDVDMNKKITRAVVDLAEGNADISIEYSGGESESAYYIYKNQSADSYDKWVKYELDIPSVKILEKNITVAGNDTVCAALDAKVSIPKFASSMGDRVFFTPCLISRDIDVPKELEERNYPIVYSSPYCEIDLITYNLPKGAVIEAQPEDINLETEYYKFTSQIHSVDSSKITYIRCFEVKSAEMPASEYTAYREFLKSIVQADLRKVVVKKEKFVIN